MDVIALIQNYFSIIKNSIDSFCACSVDFEIVPTVCIFLGYKTKKKSQILLQCVIKEKEDQLEWNRNIPLSLHHNNKYPGNVLREKQPQAKLYISSFFHSILFLLSLGKKGLK